MQPLSSSTQHHLNPKGGGYFRTAHDAEQLIARELQQHDGAIPSANSLAINALVKLGSLTADDAWRVRAEQTLRAVSSTLSQAPWALQDALLGLDYMMDGAKEVLLVIPPDAPQSAKQHAAFEDVLSRIFLPNHVLVTRSENDTQKKHTRVPWSEGKPARNGKVTAYVCEKGTCKRIPRSALSK